MGLVRKLAAAFAAVRAARRWRGRNFVIIATHANLAPVAWCCRVLSRAPFAVWAHGMETWGGMRNSVVLALRRARTIFAASRFTAAAVQKSVLGCHGHTQVLSHTMGGTLQPRNGVKRSSPEPRVLTVARLQHSDAYKGVDTLLLSWPLVLSRIPAAELHVVGEGGDRVRLQRLATRLGLDRRVHFLGQLDDSALVDCYTNASIFALPGRVREGRNPAGEGFGLVFLEAAAAGLPSVAGRAGGAVEAVEDGVTGVLVDPEQPREVAEAIVHLLSNPSVARRMGESGRVRVAREFSYERFSNGVTELVTAMVRG